MDGRFLAWGRAVKARRAARCAPVPPAAIWLFTDVVRAPAPLAAVRALAPGLGGVVLRQPDAAGRARLCALLAPICRARRLALSIAGDARLARRFHAGLHLSRGRRERGAEWVRFLTSSAHDRCELVRCRRAGVALAFLSPLFASASHPGTPGLRPCRWSALARHAGVVVAALGGIDAACLPAIPRDAAALGAIGALRGAG